MDKRQNEEHSRYFVILTTTTTTTNPLFGAFMSFDASMILSLQQENDHRLKRSLSVGWMVGWLVGWLVDWLVG